MRLFYSINPKNIHTSDSTISGEYLIKVWKPSSFSIFPHRRSLLKSLVFWFFERIKFFPQSSYGGLQIFDGAKLIHTSLYFPKFFRFPFMENSDSQIGDVWTDPQYRNKSIAQGAINYLCSHELHNAGSVWYVTDVENIESQRVATKSGFKLIGIGEKTSRYFISQHVIQVLMSIQNSGKNQEDLAKNELKHFEQIYSSGEHFSGDYLRNNLLLDSESKFVQLLTKFSPNSKSIEIGSGFGSHAIIAAKAGSNVLGVDISPSAVEIANKNSKKMGLENKCAFISGEVSKVLLDHKGVFSLIIDHESLASFQLKALMCSIIIGSTSNATFIGVESLSNNPIFKLNRWIGYKMGKRTYSEYINAFTKNEIDIFNFCFHTVKVEYFHLLSPFCSILKHIPSSVGTPIRYLISKLDKFLLKIPFVKPFAFKCVLVASEPKRNIYKIIHSQLYSNNKFTTQDVAHLD